MDRRDAEGPVAPLRLDQGCAITESSRSGRIGLLHGFGQGERLAQAPHREPTDHRHGSEDLDEAHDLVPRGAREEGHRGLACLGSVQG
jgi:hypothetical protein